MLLRECFRAYDIRGIIGEQLNADSFYQIGKAISCKLKALSRTAIYIARDARLSSETLASALTQGLLDSGIDVHDLGAVPTPVMYYATASTDIDSGLMVTGSHNPAEYNGIKLVLAGKSLIQADTDALYEMVEKADFIQGKGQYRSHAILASYQERVLRDIKLSRPLKVVIDCGNGIAGDIVPQMISALGCEVIPLFCEVDGNFPNHHPDPAVEANLIDLKAAVLAHKADLGLAFDGDADRLGVVTNKAEIIWPDRLLILYAQEILQQNPGSPIVFDVKCSADVAIKITEWGGQAIMCPTGHSIVKGKMKETEAVLAGEMSGHIFFKDVWYGFDDAMYSACRLLQLLSHSKASVAEQFAAIPNRLNTPEIKIPIAEAQKFSFMQRFLETAAFPSADMIRIDGLRAEFTTGWGLLRASNTSPCLVARFEANDLPSLLAIQNDFKTQILQVDDSLVLPF